MEKEKTIKDKYEIVKEKLERASESASRNSDTLHLLVVTKGQPVEKMVEAYHAGARLFGENYPDETEKKLPEIRDFSGLEIHMIGHLQSRKAKIVAANFSHMHSIDRVSIADKLNRDLQAVNRRLPVFLEMNVGGEESKQGFEAWDRSKWDLLLNEINKISEYSNLIISGLMTMPPLTDDPESSRPYFVRLRELRDFLQTHRPDLNLSELSMGTSSDYEVAIKEGATFIRVGTAIMGHRPPKN